MTSIAENAAYFMSSMVQEPSAQCAAATVQQIEEDQLTIGLAECYSTFSAGINNSNQSVNCNNQVTLAATAKATAMQTTNASTDCENIIPFICNGYANASNITDMQSSIAQYMNSRCDATVNQSIKGEHYTINEIVAQDCNIFSNESDQKFVCVNSISAQAQIDQSASQTATASVVDAGGMSLVFLIIALAIAFVYLMTTPFKIVTNILTFKFNPQDYIEYDKLMVELKSLAAP